jgi:DNA-binding response OmpR family regulator
MGAVSTIDRPTVLLVGEGERMKDALVAALERHQLMVEWVATHQAVDAAFAAAPDLLVLLGDAAADDGRPVLTRLEQTPATATIPVVLLSSAPGLDRRVKAFRHGVVAVVPRTASADGMARRLAQLARELPERSGETAGELGEGSIDELVALFSQQLRTGILAVSAADDQAGSAQVVLRAGRPVTEVIEELVARLKPLAEAQAGPLRFEFHESTSARLSLLDDEDAEGDDLSALRERRVLLVEQNPARADVLVQELRAHRALVVVVDGQGTGLDRARALDPEVVILDGSGVEGWALPTLRALRRDPRLRWASLLVVDAAELWPERAAGPELGRLAASVRSLVRADRELGERAAQGASFDTRLEVIGPSRTLRALTGTGLGLRLTVGHPRVRVEVDLADGLVAGARALAPSSGREVAKGPAALAALLAIGSGRVHVERKDAPASADVMAPVDDAIAAAGREKAPIRPSIPPPAGTSEPPRASKPAEPASPAPEKLIGRLEELLERLQKVLPAAEAAAAAAPAAPATKAIPPPEPQPEPQHEAPRPSLRKPPPGALPPARLRPGKATLVLGSVPTPSPDEDDDIPVIEATAEPSAASSAASSAAAPAPVPTPSVPRPSASPTTTARSVPPSPPAASLPTRRPAPSATERMAVEAEAPPPAAAPAAVGGPPAAAVPAPESALQAPEDEAPWLASSEIEAPWLASTELDAHVAVDEPVLPPPALEPYAVEAAFPPAVRASVPPSAPSATPVAVEPAPIAARPRRGLALFAVAGLAVLTVMVVAGGAVAYLLWAGEDPAQEARISPAEPAPVDRPAAAQPTSVVVPSTPPPVAEPTPPPAEPTAVEPAPTDAAPTAAPTEAAPAPTEAAPAPTEAAPAEPAPTPTEAPIEAAPSEADDADDEDGEAARSPREEQIAQLIRLANYQRNQGNLAPAESNYIRALELDRGNPRALVGLVRLNLARGTSEGAVRWARRLVASRPGNAANHVLLGDALAAAGSRRAAIAAWEHALELSPSSSSARSRLASNR